MSKTDKVILMHQTEMTGKTLKYPTHNIWCTARVPNQESPSYEAEVLRIHCALRYAVDPPLFRP
jgi:hypothetical protein